MDSGRSINPLQCWKELGIYRLAARIHDLKNEGYPVGSDWLEVGNRYGEKVKVKRYYKMDLPRFTLKAAIEEATKLVTEEWREAKRKEDRNDGLG